LDGLVVIGVFGVFPLSALTAFVAESRHTQRYHGSECAWVAEIHTSIEHQQINDESLAQRYR
jgi:hypothetical protein